MAFYAHPINTDYTVSTIDDGHILILGTSSLSDSSGAIRVVFHPDADFQGSFGVMSRPAGQIAYDRKEGFYAAPYRRIFVNGAPSDYGLDTAPLLGGFDIQVPANAASVGLMVSCIRGGGYLYWAPVTRGSDVVGASTDGSAVGANVVVVSDSFARPANTTAYTAGDVVSNSATTTRPMSFLGLAKPGRSATIVNAVLTTDKSAHVAAITAHCFTSRDVVVAADNAAATTLWQNAPYYVGALAFPSMTGGAGTNTMVAALLPNPGLTFAPVGNLGGLYVVLVDNTGATPASGQQFRLDLTVVRN